MNKLKIDLKIDNRETSFVWDSCAFTAKASGQTLPEKPYTIPDEATRYLRARLLLEETLETIKALGFRVTSDHTNDIFVWPSQEYAPDLEEIIDGCCDVDYVATGTLVACGVPDLPHFQEVCRANNDKFPDGKGVPHPTIPGKYGKPDGWRGPDHLQFFPKRLKEVVEEMYIGGLPNLRYGVDVPVPVPVIFGARLIPCDKSPAGWYCTRGKGHEGPCAAHPQNHSEQS